MIFLINARKYFVQKTLFLDRCFWWYVFALVDFFFIIKKTHVRSLNRCLWYVVHSLHSIPYQFYFCGFIFTFYWIMFHQQLQMFPSEKICHLHERAINHLCLSSKTFFRIQLNVKNFFLLLLMYACEKKISCKSCRLYIFFTMKCNCFF